MSQVHEVVVEIWEKRGVNSWLVLSPVQGSVGRGSTSMWETSFFVELWSLGLDLGTCTDYTTSKQKVYIESSGEEGRPPDEWGKGLLSVMFQTRGVAPRDWVGPRLLEDRECKVLVPWGMETHTTKESDPILKLKIDWYFLNMG